MDRTAAMRKLFLLGRKLGMDKDAIRVCGPFEVMSLGRYSVEDWKGYVVREAGIDEAARLENYIAVICRLYRKDSSIQGATGLVHAVAETEYEKTAISVGPLSGRVTSDVMIPRRAFSCNRSLMEHCSILPVFSLWINC